MDYTLTQPVSFWRSEDGNSCIGKSDVYGEIASLSTRSSIHVSARKLDLANLALKV
jgi:hypothetical protein